MVCKYLICMVRTGWVNTGLVCSCQDMSGRNIYYPTFLDLKLLWIQNILGDQKIIWPEFLWTQNLFWNQNLFGPKFLPHSAEILVSSNSNLKDGATKWPYCCHTRLHLGFSAKLRIWQVSACKMESRSGNISWKNHPPTIWIFLVKFTLLWVLAIYAGCLRVVLNLKS